MATYRQDITRSVEPQMANPELLARAGRAQAEATTTTLGTVADTMFGVYVGSKKAELREDLQGQVASLQAEMDAVKQADITAKAAYEEEMGEVPSRVDAYRSGVVVAGEDPEAVRSATTTFAKKEENAIVARFRAEQQKVAAARDAVPERYNEFMSRSEKILKQYITQNPGLANAFRKVALEVTGKEGLELYSVKKLYEDVNYIEKQKEAAGKAFEKAQEAMLAAYVKDRVKGGASETQAMAEFKAVPPDQRLELANASVQQARSKEEAEAALKAGGNQLLNFATITVGDFGNVLIANNSKVYAQLMNTFKLSRADIASGNIPESVKNNADYKKLIADAGTSVLQLLDAQYTEAVAKLNTKARTTPADADKVKTAKGVLDAWYKEQTEFYTKNPASWLTAVATKDDRETVIQKRLNIVDTMVRSLGIPADVVAQLGMSGDTQGYNTARGRYPRAAAIIDHANMLREKVLSGVTTEEFTNLLGQIDKYKVSQVTPPPTTKNERLASLSVNQQLHEKLRTDAITGAVTSTTAEDLAKYVASSFHDPANTEQVLAKGTSIISQTLSRLPEADKAGVVKSVNESANFMLYSTTGHGNKAKNAFLEFKRDNETFLNAGKTTDNSFADETGASPLKIVSRRTDNRPRPVGRAGPPANIATLTEPVESNKVLSAVDDMLRVQSLTTGTPIQQLRQNFIKNFDIKGSALPSDVFTAEFERAAGAAPAANAGITGGGKRTASMADVARYAAEKKISVSDAVSQLEAEGVDVVGN